MNASILSELKKNKTYLEHKEKEQVMQNNSLTLFEYTITKNLYFSSYRGKF